ncbi:uncharacterized protein P174DRAFT_197697 [Aspergillus novofumigatus IBT 16806]|uniref:Uncharacterized protein n=1 Tax=Aspergillus novofumigatus (strain IBT 16806) TaxID=1392255 RepID=A0A2I1C431_ASPN1|nr:uncharacterized protein P174DRAFT_197697 [Aspergillus novofumigatus IBT 16806]PKX92368.1 hypothetical protein P174DRAFT_197697 [Aspergillus novofumigatus IBT 16806]
MRARRVTITMLLCSNIAAMTFVSSIHASQICVNRYMNSACSCEQDMAYLQQLLHRIPDRRLITGNIDVVHRPAKALNQVLVWAILSCFLGSCGGSATCSNVKAKQGVGLGPRFKQVL